MSASRYATTPSDYPAPVNPFRDAIAGDPWRPGLVDVPEIGGGVFQTVLQRLEEVHRTPSPQSVLLHGDPGSGKTHLLARLRRHLCGADWISRDTNFVDVRLDTAPSRLWRHLRKRLAGALLKPAGDDAGISQLDWALCRRLARPGSRGRWLDQLKEQLRDGLPFHELRLANALARCWGRLTPRQIESWGRLWDELDGTGEMSPNLARVVEHLFHRRHNAIAVAWLRGEPLAEEDLRRLRLAAEEDTGEDAGDEQSSKEIVLALLRLTPCSVVAFDQVEALRASGGEDTGLKAFGKIASDLHHHCGRLLILTCIQTSYRDRLREALEAPDYDRLAMSAVALPLLTEPWGRALARARLDAAGAAERRLDWAAVAPLFQDGKQCTARVLLARCAALYDRPGQPVRPPRDRNQSLREEWEVRFQRALESQQAESTDEVLAHALPGLAELLGVRVETGGRDVHVRWQPRGKPPVAISLCNQKNLASLAARLRRLHENGERGLVLVRHKDLPIRRTARACRRYLQDLETGGAKMLHPSAEALAALDAMRQLLADARAGDLSFDGETVSPDSVIEWLRREIPEPLRDLAAAFESAPEPASSTLREDLLEILQEENLLAAADAARRLDCRPDDLRHLAARCPELFGWLAGTPPVVFRVPSGVGRV